MSWPNKCTCWWVVTSIGPCWKNIIRSLLGQHESQPFFCFCVPTIDLLFLKVYHFPLRHSFFPLDVVWETRLQHLLVSREVAQAPRTAGSCMLSSWYLNLDQRIKEIENNSILSQKRCPSLWQPTFRLLGGLWILSSRNSLVPACSQAMFTSYWFCEPPYPSKKQPFC